jgi:hypothetical protein
LAEHFQQQEFKNRESAMSMSEMMRQSADALNAQRIDHMNQKDAEFWSKIKQLEDQIEAMKQEWPNSNPETLASAFSPIAQSLASVAEDCRDMIAELNKHAEAQSRSYQAQSRQMAESFSRPVENVAQELNTAIREAQQVTANLKTASAQMSWKYLGSLAILTLIIVLIVNSLWIWLGSNKITVTNNLDPQAVAEYLKPSLIKAVRHSNGK